MHPNDDMKSLSNMPKIDCYRQTVALRLVFAFPGDLVGGLITCHREGPSIR